MTFTENAEKSAIFALEHPLDAGVAGRGQPRRVKTIARRETVVHALAHRLVLRGHQAGRLGAGQAEGVLQLRWLQAAQLARRHRGRVGAKDGSRVPAAVQHLGAVQRVPDPRAHLEAGDRRQQEFGPAYGSSCLRPRRRRGQQRRNE